MTVEIVLVISIISVVFGVMNTVVNMRRNNKRDDKQEAKDATAMLVKLENISGDVREIKASMNSMREKQDAIFERVIMAEQSLKSAWKRIESIENNQTR